MCTTKCRYLNGYYYKLVYSVMAAEADVERTFSSEVVIHAM